MNKEDFLAHYGTKGMKWGVRKEDDGGGSQSARRGSVKNLSDTELRSRINRLNMETQYLSLIEKSNKANQGLLSKGFDTVSGIVGNAAKQSVTNFLTKSFTKYLKKTFNTN